uniref:Uncharacterized protein n=1 Tax=Cacopsylla melanoneura TaxID=428564 RepID=A0A8D8ZYL5_9HEMI
MVQKHMLCYHMINICTDLLHISNKETWNPMESMWPDKEPLSIILLNSIPIPSVGIKEEKKEDKVKDKTVVEGLSYGQRAGLKDDLEVEEDVGEKIFAHFHLK